MKLLFMGEQKSHIKEIWQGWKESNPHQKFWRLLS